MRDDRGSGTILTVGMALGLVALMMLLLPLYSGLAIRQSVVGAADAAALAAADTASGLVPGIACDAAQEAATANGASVELCSVDGLVVTVRVGRVILGVGVKATATAGPPD